MSEDRECRTCFRLCDSCDVLWARPARTVGEHLYLVREWLTGMVWWHRHNTFWFTCRDCREIRRASV